MTFPDLEALWIKAGGPPALASTMAAIAGAESTFGTNVNNPSNPNVKGIWQINTAAWPQFDAQRLVSDPLYNAQAAVYVYQQQGLTAWEGYTNGTWQSFLQSSGASDSWAANKTAGVVAHAQASEWPVATQRLVAVPVALALGWMLWGALH